LTCILKFHEIDTEKLAEQAKQSILGLRPLEELAFCP